MITRKGSTACNSEEDSEAENSPSDHSDIDEMEVED
eukprot:CAMPEP_0205816702 /NCGR_PEP_ID=MMETSP0205-20121125/23176_1 /ASSEMBLY_ACC=CAM_ASM_000278 /TAXON_ID=36767 /ORGANISM="Euplotes focardii, Strain TN1" /LENGTH=35 /DNA_ID= /DNA_START= /DNA_END= /DNA_ORIENTATION=